MNWDRETLWHKAKALGFGDMRMGRVEGTGDGDEGKPCVLLATPYARTPAARVFISAYYFASQRAYLALCALERQLRTEGLAVHRNDAIRLKPLASRTGLGRYGANSLIIHRKWGSQIVLGALVLEEGRWPVDQAEQGPASACQHCGRCAANCPAGAIDGFARIDLSRCLRAQMLTGQPVPLALRESMGNRLIGCDHCLAACPYNAGKTAPAQEYVPELERLLALDTAQYRALAQQIGSNFARRNRILAQALLVAANSGDARYLPQAQALTGFNQEAVREHARYCVWRLSSL